MKKLFYTIVALVAAAYFYDIIRDNAYVSAAFRGMRAGVAAVIADVVVSMAAPFLRRDKVIYACIMAGSFLIAFLLEINVAIIVGGSALLGVAIGVLRRKKRAGK